MAPKSRDPIVTLSEVIGPATDDDTWNRAGVQFYKHPASWDSCRQPERMRPQGKRAKPDVPRVSVGRCRYV